MAYGGGVADKKPHNERFAELQEQYLKTRSGGCLSRMYRLCADLAGNYIRKYARERRLELDAADLSHDSAVYVIEQYLKKPGFKIKRISAYMYYGCLKTLGRDKKWEQGRTSYDDYIREREREYAAEEPAAEEPSGRGPAPVKQGLLFADPATGKEYEEIYVQRSRVRGADGQAGLLR
jgi:hypothetical protein